MHGWHKRDGARDARIGRGTPNEGEMKINNEKCRLAKYRWDRADTLCERAIARAKRNKKHATKLQKPEVIARRVKINGREFWFLSRRRFLWGAESVGELHDARCRRALLIVTCVSLSIIRRDSEMSVAGWNLLFTVRLVSLLILWMRSKQSTR